jgi:hypothetical protein
MGSINIPNLKEDRLTTSEQDLSASTELFIKPSVGSSSTAPSSATTQGSNLTLPAATVSSSASNQDTVPVPGGSASLTSGTEKYEPKGIPATGGTFTPVKQNKLPIVYFNFKQNDFYDQNLMFRFKTSNLTSSDLTGNTISTWTSDSTAGLALTLTGTNKLKVVKAYDKYFYELIANSDISNAAVSLPVKTSPAYTVFVFALGLDNFADEPLRLLAGSNIIHKFVHNNNQNNFFNPYANIVNFGKETNGFSNFFASFVGGTLNSPKYLPSRTGNTYPFSYNNPDAYFWNNINYYLGKPNQSFSKFNVFNIRNLRNDITAPTVAQDFQLFTNVSTSVNMKTFSLFFVEMFTYVTEDVANANAFTVNFETIINGQQTFLGKQSLNGTTVLDTNTNYIISLNNKTVTGYPAARMFLFDYLHGTANTIPQMRSNSKKIIEALTYDYRNIFLKKTTDLQISNNEKSLLFAPKIPHPFLNMFFTSASA